MTATSAAWLLTAFLLGYLAHSLKVAFDPRGEWNRGHEAGRADSRRGRRAREGPGPAGVGAGLGLGEGRMVGAEHPERN